MGFLNLEGLRYLTAQLKTLFATKTYVDEKFENSGTVKSVANIGPDGTGNVALTAENIQAIPNTAAVVSYLEDGTPGDAIPLNADTLGGRPAEDFALSENGLPTVEASKSGTVFQIDSVEAQQFILVPDADYVDGDTFTIAGRSVEAKLPNGTSLPGNFFIAGSKIICLLNNNTLYFAAGGGAGGGGSGTAKLCIYKAAFAQEGWTLKTDEETSESWYEQTVALEAYNTNKSATPNTVLLTPMFMKEESEEENSANAELVSFINDSGQVSVGDATVTVKAVLDSAPSVSGTVYWASTDVVGIAGGGSVPDNVMLYRMDDDTPGQPPAPVNADTLQGHAADYFVAQETLDAQRTYSAKEQWTGEHWIDGKKIYRKYMSVPVDGATKRVSHLIDNIGDFKRFDTSKSCIEISPNGKLSPVVVPMYIRDTYYTALEYVGEDEIQIFLGGELLNYKPVTAKLILLYTKNET